MSEALYQLEPDEVLLEADYPDDYELSTNRLRSGDLAKESNVIEDVDWVLKLRNKSLSTQQLPDEAIQPNPQPSGMASHTAPARIVPTRAARLRTGLRRGTLLIVLSVLAGGVLAGAGYLLASTSWLSNLYSSSTTPPPVASSPAQPNSSGTDSGSNSIPEPPAPQANPNNPIDQSTNGSAESEALAGLDARNLRDKGIAAYKAGNYSAAITNLEDSVSIQSDDPVAQYQLGLAYMAVQSRDHSLDDAELAFRTAVSLQPRWAAPYQMIAETLMRRGYYEQAVTPALEATQLDPNMSQAWMTLGRAYSGAGHNAEATKAFAQATKLAPAPPPAQP